MGLNDWLVCFHAILWAGTSARLFSGSFFLQFRPWSFFEPEKENKKINKLSEMHICSQKCILEVKPILAVKCVHAVKHVLVIESKSVISIKTPISSQNT